MVLIFSRSTYLFLQFWFRVLASQIASTLLAMMNGPSSPDLSPLDYQVWGQCWSLNTSCNRSQSWFPSLKLHFSWFGLPHWSKPLITLWKTTTGNCRHVCGKQKRKLTPAQMICCWCRW